MQIFVEFFLTLFGLFPSKDIAESATESKTLAIMLIVGLIFFAGFTLFLYKMSQ